MLVCLATCCKREEKTEPSPAQPEIPPAAKWLDGPRSLDFRQPVPLGHYLGPGHVHGVGKIAEGGYATFDDGTLWVTRGRDTKRFEAGAPFDGSATELTIAQVTNWQSETISTVTTLTGAIESARSESVRMGAALGARTAVRIEGVAISRSFRIGVQDIQIPSQAVVVIGFVDGPFHAVVASIPTSGEVTDLEFDTGARVMIPNNAILR